VTEATPNSAPHIIVWFSSLSIQPGNRIVTKSLNQLGKCLRRGRGKEASCRAAQVKMKQCQALGDFEVAGLS